MTFWDRLPEEYTPCHRCGWPVDDGDAVEVSGGGSVHAVEVLHPFCVRRSHAGHRAVARSAERPVDHHR